MSDKFNEFVSRRPDSEGRERYCDAAALIFYRKESDYRNIPQSLKYRADFSSGRYFARLLGDKLASSDWFRDVDAIVPVPLHWWRKWKRGYNQAEILARGLAAGFGKAQVLDILVRKRSTSTQTRLDPEAKLANVKGAFAVKRRKLPKQPKHILIVDDVFTSGSTTSECYNALRDHFGYGVRISVATIAFVQD